MTQQSTYCPYLGTKFDRNTKWGYASHLATCYLSEREPFAPSLSHQQRFCLTERYAQCFRLTGQPTVVAPSYEQSAGATPAQAPAARGSSGVVPLMPLGGSVSQPPMFASSGGPADPGQPVQPMRANPGDSFVPGQPYSRATPTTTSGDPTQRPMTGRYAPRTNGDASGAPRAGIADVFQGIVNGASGLGRLGLAALGAILLLLFAVIFVVQVFGNSGGSSTAAAKATPTAATKGVLPPTLPTPQSATDPTASAKNLTTPTPAVRQGRIANTGGSGVRMRSEPSTAGGDATVLVTIPEAAAVEIIATREAADGRWFQVRYETRTGWVRADFVQ